jgi:enoyl-CoA hydratase/carnithine racemase
MEVTRTDVDGLATLTIDRPQVLNALSPGVFVELRRHLEEIAGDVDGVGVVVVRGAGRSFSAGNDLKAIARGEVAPGAHFQAETIDLIAELAQPVIASVRGHCFTGALELVLACDLVVASDTARFADTHGRWSMSPTWGMSQRLPRRIGALAARDLMLTGREVGAEEALAVGLVSRCVPDDELEGETEALARACLANSWHSLRSVKRLVRRSLETSLTDGLAYERATSRAGPDMQERIAAFGARG